MLTTIGIFLKLVWMRIYYFLFDKNKYKESKTTRTILCIGDGFAEGFGDYFSIGSLCGLSNRIESLIRKDNRLRFRWQFVNAGKYGSTSNDWLPSNPNSLYNKIFGSSKFDQVEVVLIMLGSCDSL